MIDNAQLLEEIRELLIPISALSMIQLREEGARTLKVMVGSGQRMAAAQLMDGTKTRQEIQRAAKISAPNLSTLVKQLREGGLVTEREGRPKLVLPPKEVWRQVHRRDG